MLRLLALSIVLTLLAAAPAGAFRHVVSRNGRVGPFQVDQSTTARVRAVLGQPGRTSTVPGEGGVTVIEWTYGCGHGKAQRYFFNTTGVLASFVTDCRSWRTADGTRVGMSIDEAEEREHKRARVALCGSGLAITRRGRARMYVTMNEAQTRVFALAVEDHASVLGC